MLRIVSLITILIGVAVPSSLCYALNIPSQLLPRSGYPGVSIIFVTAAAYIVLHFYLARRRWALELCGFIAVSPPVMLLAYLANGLLYDSDRLVNSLRLFGRHHSILVDATEFVLSPFTLVPAVFGAIAGIVVTVLDRWLVPLTIQKDSQQTR